MNQNPEQIARDKIDNLLEQAGWKIQPKSKIDFSAGKGIAVREYQTVGFPQFGSHGFAPRSDKGG